jgi:hypothetical protein
MPPHSAPVNGADTARIQRSHYCCIGFRHRIINVLTFEVDDLVSGVEASADHKFA